MILIYMKLMILNSSAIATVCLDNYKSVQQAIKDAREDKEYEQTK